MGWSGPISGFMTRSLKARAESRFEYNTACELVSGIAAVVEDIVVASEDPVGEPVLV